jgi:hypothetical protein
MKSFRSTGIMLVLVAVLAGYTLWEYKKADSDADTAQEKKLFNFKNEDVDQLKITHKDQNLLIVREADGWKVKQPYDDLAEPSAMDAVLYSIAVQKGKAFRGEDDAKTIKWADFGLEPADSVVEVKTKAGVQTLQISSKNAFDGSFYVRQGDELMLADHGIAQAVMRDAKTFRSKRLWREPDAKIESIDVTVDGDGLKDKYRILRDGELWKLDPQPSFATEASKIETWVNTVEGLKPPEVASETLSEDDKRTDLLLKPSVIVAIKYKKPDGAAADWTLTAGQERSSDIFMYTNQRPTVYKSPSKALDRVRVPRAYFRDGKKAFAFNMEKVHAIEIHDGAFHHRFKKTDLLWKLDDGAESAKYQIEQDRLINMIQNLASLEAQEFPSSAQGMKPDQRITLLDDKGGKVFEINWGDEYKSQVPYNKGLSFRYVKSNLEKEAMGVAASKIATLVDKSMIKPVTAAVAPPAPDKAKANP